MPSLGFRWRLTLCEIDAGSEEGSEGEATDPNAVILRRREGHSKQQP